MGGPSTCEVWFEYGDDNPNNLDESTPPELMDETGPFEAFVEDLNSGTTYWVRAVADNGVLTSKGEIKEFSTLSGRNSFALRLFEHRKVVSSLSDYKKAVMSQMLDRLKDVNGLAIEELLNNNPIMARFFYNQIVNI